MKDLTISYGITLEELTELLDLLSSDDAKRIARFAYKNDLPLEDDSFCTWRFYDLVKKIKK